jgi:hypothetical protein
MGGYSVLAFRAKAKELKGVVKNTEMMRFVQLFFQFMDRTFINGDGTAALQTGEVMAIFLGQAID